MKYKKGFLSLLVIPFFFIGTSCSETWERLDETYYRILYKSNSSLSGLDISLLNANFGNVNGPIQTRLDKLNNHVITPGETNKEYINNRTFSICADSVKSGYVISGTGWIIARDMSNISTRPHDYWMLTNWHVSVDWKMNGNSFSDPKWMCEYNPNSPTPFDRQTNSFVSLKEANEQSSSITQTSDLITPFDDSFCTSTTSTYDTGGFPFNNSINKFVFASPPPFHFPYYFPFSSSEKNKFKLSSYSKVYSSGNWYLSDDMQTDLMDHGSSGSMIIDSNTRKVVSIYFGITSSRYADYGSGVVLSTLVNGQIWNNDFYYNYNKIHTISEIIGCNLTS